MANRKQRALLKKGVSGWNEWRKKNLNEKIDLSGANLRWADLSRANLSDAELSGADLRMADLRMADLSGACLWEASLNEANLSKADLSKATLSGANLGVADLTGANLREANLRKARLSEADLHEATLSRADLREANLSGANLSEANLSEADLHDANLSAADLSKSNLVGTKFQGADLTDCRIYGVSAWNVKLEGASQKNLIITEDGEPTLTVDDLEVAQFIYLLLNNEKIKNVIDTITSKAVLILGRFSEERMKVLDSIREELRQRGYLPILFVFKPSASRDPIETVTLLARMARFIIVDLTDPKSVPDELSSIIPDLPSVPVQPIILSSQKEYAMYEHWTGYRSVLKTLTYKSVDDLLADIPGKVISLAESSCSRRNQGNKNDVQAIYSTKS